ncbi:MAG: CvpA family protein [Syntrophomonas sp.]
MHFNLLDYGIITILLLSAITGLRRGFIDALGGILSTVLALVAAVLYFGDGAAYLERYFGLGSLLTTLIKDKVPVLALSPDQSILGQGLLAAPAVTDPAHYLAQLLVAAVAFLLVFGLASVVLKLVFACLNSLFSLGMLGGVNRIMGMLLVLIKNLLILVIIFGVAYEPIYLAARMGWDWAGIATGYMNKSVLTAGLMDGFGYIKALL